MRKVKMINATESNPAVTPINIPANEATKDDTTAARRPTVNIATTARNAHPAAFRSLTKLCTLTFRR